MEMVMSQQVRRIAEFEASEGKLQHGKRKVGEESRGNISAYAASLEANIKTTQASNAQLNQRLQ